MTNKKSYNSKEAKKFEEVSDHFFNFLDRLYTRKANIYFSANVAMQFVSEIYNLDLFNLDGMQHDCSEESCEEQPPEETPPPEILEDDEDV